MASLTTYQALRTWFEANWLTTLRRFENENLQTPDALEPFVYMEARGNLFGQMSIGSAENKWRENGAAYFYVCVASGLGVLLARGYVSALVDMMRGLTLAPDITCREISVGISGPFRDDGNYYAIPVITRWQRDAVS